MRRRNESEGYGGLRSGAMTANFNNRKIRQNSYMTQKPSMQNLGGTQTLNNQVMDEMDPGLDLLNRVQMFQIAVNKINHNLEVRKKEPIFKLASHADNGGSNNNNFRK